MTSLEEASDCGEQQSASSSLLSKLSILLPQETVTGGDDYSNNNKVMAFGLERGLAAWVLLTRLDDSELQEAWKTYGTQLEAVALRILLTSDLDDDNNDMDCQGLYIRIIAQATSRLCVELYPTILGKAMLEAWKPNHDLYVHMDLCTSLEAFMESNPTEANDCQVWEQVWQIYKDTTTTTTRSNRTGTMPQTQEKQKPMEIKENLFSESETENDLEKSEWKLMKQTLHALLADDTLAISTSGSDREEEATKEKAWHETMLGLFESQGMELFPNELIPSVLAWIVQPSTITLSSSFRLAWNECILTLLQSRLMVDPACRRLLLDQATATRLHQVLLSLVVSPETTTDASLRAMAWQTMVALVETCGWQWLFQHFHDDDEDNNDDFNKPLGLATKLCFWIRLAAGEWRIQLQWQQSTTLSDSQKTGWQQATALPVGHGCARFLSGAVQYLVQYAENDVPKSMPPLSPDALLHLRQSLEQSLWTTVEYLCLSMEEEEELTNTTHHNDRRTSVSLFQISLRLFGALLMEVDIWDLLAVGEEQDQEQERSSPAKTIVECLQRLLPHAHDSSLLPGLVHILGGADNNAEKQACLGNLWEPLFEYLEWYWQQEVINETIPWACSCTELWACASSSSSSSSSTENKNDNNTVDASQKRRLCLALVRWIQNVLQTPPSGSPSSITSTLTYLSLALGVYMTLSKDRPEPPKEHESRVILRALQWCERG